MRRLPISLLAMVVAVAAAVLGSSDATAAPPASCGPGSHWADTCVGPPPPPHPDFFPTSGALVGVDTNNDCSVDQNLVMSGPTTVDRQDRSDDSAQFPGTRPVDAHLDVIDTEIVSMSLTGGGFTLSAGVNAPGINPSVPATRGAVAEQPGDNTMADSFFDVFFEIQLPSGPPNLYNQLPLIVTDVIDRVPPVGATYIHPTGCIPLHADPLVFSPTGVNLVTAQHLPDGFPPVGGTAEVVSGGDSPLSASDGSSAAPYAALGGSLAAAVAMVGAAGWYARRRWLR